MSIEAMKQALEALNRINRDSVSREHAQLMSEEAITALRQAIEQAQQAEPVAWFRYESVYEYRNQLARCTPKCIGAFPVYTAPPPRQPLTDEQISNLWDGHTVPVFGKTGINPIVFARAIEAAHRIGGEK